MNRYIDPKKLKIGDDRSTFNVARAYIQNVVLSKIYDDFNYKIDRLLEVLEQREDEFKDDEFYNNLLKDIENLKG